MWDADRIRAHFPALSGGALFFDNPGGTQAAREAVDRVTRYLLETNANHGGAFQTSRQSDAVVEEARAAAADFLHARQPEEIVFGPNMTTLTLHVSRSLAHLLQAGDEILVTRLDHDANVSPWLLVAEDRQCSIRWLDFHPEDCTWSAEDFRRSLTPRTKIAAFGYASNAVGTVNPVREAVAAAREVGVLTYIDAVQYAPHGAIDVQKLGCDFLAFSAYKVFGPHLGILYGRLDWLERLKAYKVRPADNRPPGKWETGTQSFESIAGLLGALEYLEWLGVCFGGACGESSGGEIRRSRLEAALEVIRTYELNLSRALVEQLNEIRGLRIHGVTRIDHLSERVPTVAFTLEGHHPRAVAEALGKQAIYVWDGNYYALEVMNRLGYEGRGGMVRVGAVHYNTVAEVEQLAAALRGIAR